MSSIPAVCDWLVANLPPALTGWEVLDGPPIVDFEADGLSIGYVPDEMSVTSKEGTADLGGGRLEVYDVNCLLWSYRGDEDVKPVRDRCFEALAAISVKLKGTTMGGVVARAQVRFVDFDQQQNAEGAWGVMVFAIECQAFK